MIGKAMLCGGGCPAYRYTCVWLYRCTSDAVIMAFPAKVWKESEMCTRHGTTRYGTVWHIYITSRYVIERSRGAAQSVSRDTYVGCDAYIYDLEAPAFVICKA